MKKFLLLPVFTVLLSLLLTASFAQNSIIDSIAIISDYEGDSMAKFAGKPDFENVRMNMPVFEGTEFKTGPGSFVEITFDDASIVRLSENTTLKLSELKRNGQSKRTLFDLAVGKILAIVDSLKTEDSTFEVHTKMAIAAVKGTELAVTSDGSETDELGVFEGKVSYKSKSSPKLIEKMILKGKQARMLKGNDSPFDAEDMKEEMLKLTKEMGDMKEEILLVRKLKQEGDNKVLEYRLKRKLEKEGKTEGDSETTLTVGGKNSEDTKKAESRIKKHLKQAVRKELMGLRQHAMNDLKWVSSEMKADLNLGKTMTDVHGNRIRLEEYVFRPQADELDLLSITFRDNRLDYLRAQNFFNAPLPKRLNKEVFQSSWVLQPKVYKIGEKVTLSNTIDRVTTEVIYKLDPRLDLAATNDPNAFNYYSDNSLWRLQITKNDLAINGDIKTSRELTGSTNNYSMTNAPGFADPITTGGPLNPGSDNLAWTSTTTYRKAGADNGWLKIELYLIDDYGKIMQSPESLGDWASLILDTNVEMRLTSSDFVSDEGDIDIVSKMLWWIALNPKR